MRDLRLLRDDGAGVSPRQRRARARTILSALVWTLAGTSGCGRIGYDVEEGAPPERDASADRRALAEASGGNTVDAPEQDATADGGPEAAADAGAQDGPADGADAGCVVSATTTYCTAVPPLLAPPVIDGVLDCGPGLVTMTPEFWSGPAPLPPFPAGNSTQIAAAWRPDGLYVFLAVTTPAAFPADPGDPVFYGAGVELFVDDDGVYTDPPAYDDPGTIQIVVTAPGATSPTRRAEMYRNAVDEGPWTSTEFGTYATTSGFVFEGFVVAADLGLPAWTIGAGATLGFDVAIDVSYPTATQTGPQGHRVGQYFFHVAPPPVGDAAAIGAPFADPRSFCTPELAPM